MGVAWNFRGIFENRPLEMHYFYPLPSEPFGDDIPQKLIFYPLAWNFQVKKRAPSPPPSWNFQGPRPRVYGLKMQCANEDYCL